MPESQLQKPAVEVLTPEEQLKQLRAYLATSEPFRHCRGNFGSWTGTGMFSEMKDATPTAILEEFDWRNSQLRVVMNHLAKLRRDGHMVAFEELSHAVNNGNFVITGEDIPLDERKSGVLLVYEPKRMLELIKWMKLICPQLLDWQLGHPDYCTEDFIQKGYIKDRPGLLPWTREVLDQNLELRVGLENYYAALPGKHRSSFAHTHFVPDSLMPGIWKKFPKDENARHMLQYGGRLLRIEEDQRGANTNVIGNWGVAWFFPETTQREVLSLIKREHQDEVATWQFKYPAHMNRLDGYTASIGLFPEKELDRFRTQWPSFVSGSLTHGFGAVLMESRHSLNMTDPIFDLDRWRKQQQEPDKNQIGIKLHFLRYED